jgi:hypothetical protein
MKLRDRLRRWWSPAQWADDHPAERKQRDQPDKGGTRDFGPGGDYVQQKVARDFKKFERDLKKPR